MSIWLQSALGLFIATAGKTWSVRLDPFLRVSLTSSAGRGIRDDPASRTMAKVSNECRSNIRQCHEKSHHRAMKFNNRQCVVWLAGPIAARPECEKRESKPTFMIPSQWMARPR
jgi:hypothetical protein